MAISGTPLFSIYFFDTFHRYNFSIYFFDILLRYFECSQFSEKQEWGLWNPLKSWENATILTYLRTTRTSRSARNSKGYRWILANSLPNLTLPFQLNDSNYLLFTTLHFKIKYSQKNWDSSPNLIYWASGTIYWVCPNLGTLKYNDVSDIQGLL